MEAFFFSDEDIVESITNSRYSIDLAGANIHAQRLDSPKELHTV